MRNCYHSALSFLGILLISGCASRVEAPKTTEQLSAKLPVNSYVEGLRRDSEGEIDLAKEAEVEKLCLTAWRKCTGGDPKSGIADLKALCKQYPKSSSVLFMTGQAIEKFGNKKDAISFYEKAANDSDFAIMSLYKIAESLRTTGNTEQSILRYRKLIAIAPKFKEAHLGLALALKKLDPNSKEATVELRKVKELESSNQGAAPALSGGVQ